MINCLIELWSNSQVNVEDFSIILTSLDISEPSHELVYSTLGRKFSDEILRPILFEFITVKLVPTIIENCHDKCLSLIAEVDEQKRINNKLQSIIVDSNIVQQQAEELKLLVEREAKEAGETKLAELERNRVKFLASNKGSNITLSENDLVTTKTGINCYENSFVAIQNPVVGKVVLSSDDDGQTFIGFFHKDYLQGESPHEKSWSYFNYSFFANYPNSIGPMALGTDSLREFQNYIIIEFNNLQVTFSIPSRDYSYTVTWPSDHVFGVHIYDQNTAWRLIVDV
ncbi:hypothetical protein RCL1_000636 [Eukaryota sp. TZLM3-RCL]